MQSTRSWKGPGSKNIPHFHLFSQPASSSLLLFRHNLVAVYNPATFQHRVELVSLEVFDGLDFTGRPFDFERIDLGRIVQTKVHAKIVVGQIAAPTEDLGCLRHPSSDEFQPRTNRKAIAL